MMQLMFSVFDEKANVYNPPFFAQTDGVAVRMIQATIEDPNSNLSRFPEDYVLYRIGAFDPVLGEVAGAKPELVVRLSALKEVRPNG